jgi:hypothetical protein
MANEMFTTRQGRQVAVPVLSIPAHITTSLMRLQEDYHRRGEHLILLGVLLDVLDKGIKQVQNQWRNGDLSKNRRNFAKAVAPLLRDPAKNAAAIASLAQAHGLVSGGTVVDMSSPEFEDELSNEQLEAATAPAVGA